jgi:hypothetical protein
MTARPSLNLRCVECGSTSGKAFWASQQRQHVIRRCKDCGANALGPGRWLPKDWAERSAIGVVLAVDPHAPHQHGHGKCNHVEQGRLF